MVAHSVVTVQSYIAVQFQNHLNYIGLPVGNVKKSTIELGLGVLFLFLFLFLLSDGFLFVSKQQYM